MRQCLSTPRHSPHIKCLENIFPRIFDIRSGRKDQSHNLWGYPVGNLIQLDTQGLNIPFMDGEGISFDEQILKRRCGVSIDYSKGSFMNFIYAVVQLFSCPLNYIYRMGKKMARVLNWHKIKITVLLRWFCTSLLYYVYIYCICNLVIKSCHKGRKL